MALIFISIFFFSPSYGQMIQDECVNTYNNTVAMLEKNIKLYNEKGFSLPGNMEIALETLKRLRQPSLAVALTEFNGNPSKGVVAYVIDGPLIEYSDYIQSCREEVFQRQCKGGYVHRDFFVECKRFPDSNNNDSSVYRESENVNRGKPYKDRNGVWRN